MRAAAKPPFSFAAENVLSSIVEVRVGICRFAAFPVGSEHDFAMLAGVLRAKAEVAAEGAT